MGPLDLPVSVLPRLGDPGSARGLTVFGELPDDVRAQLRAADIAIAAAPVRRLVARDGQLTAVELADGTAVACEALFVQPPQRRSRSSTRSALPWRRAT